MSKPVSPPTFAIESKPSLACSCTSNKAPKLPCVPPQNLVKWFESAGMPAPDLVATAVSVGEMGAGVGIILGGFFSNTLGNLLTRLSGAAVCVIMIGAFYLAHADWFITAKVFKTEQIFLFTLGLCS